MKITIRPGYKEYPEINAESSVGTVLDACVNLEDRSLSDDDHAIRLYQLRFARELGKMFPDNNYHAQMWTLWIKEVGIHRMFATVIAPNKVAIWYKNCIYIEPLTMNPYEFTLTKAVKLNSYTMPGALND